ncbi:MAG: glycosyltransferase [Rubripirellula sp.]
MRIDFVITELFVGGAERCLTEIALGLSESGDDVRVFSIGSLPKGEQSALVDRLRSSGVQVDSGQADTLTQTLAAYRQLQSWFTASPPDLAQTFLHHANVLGTRAAKTTGVSTRVAGIRVAESNPIRCQLERVSLRACTSTICVSHAVQEFAASRLGCPRETLTVIPNGVDVARFASAPPMNWSDLGWPDDAVVTLFVGRLHRQKGIELLQSQIDQIAPQGSKQRLLLVGEGPLRNELRSWSERLGPQRVQMLGWQSDVAPLMRACRLLVLPSHYEGMPNVVLEAMAAGRPVVASRVEGSDELLEHSPESQGFRPGDAAAMAMLINRFQSDESFADDIGDRNQSFVRNEFSIAAMVDAYRSHYRSLLARRREDV